MIIAALPLIFYVSFVFGSETRNVEVDFFSQCSIAIDFDELVADGTTLTVTIDDRNWPENTYTCTVVFKAFESSSDLYYRFLDFRLSHIGNLIEISSKETWMVYTDQANYTYDNSPSIGIAKITNRYLKVTCTRKVNSAPTEETPLAVFEVYSDGFSVPSKMSVGSIMGVVVGVIALIVFIVMIVMCYRWCQRKSENRGVVIQHRNQHVTTTTTSGTTPSSGLDQFSMHPVYPPADPSVGYPNQPPVYPAAHNMSYSDDPPSYDDVVNGDANFKNYS